MPTTALLCDLLTVPGDGTASFHQRLYFLPERVASQDRCPVAMACALVGAVYSLDTLRGTWGEHANGLANMDTELLPPGMVFPVGSWGWTIPKDLAYMHHRRPLPPSAWDTHHALPADVCLALDRDATPYCTSHVITVFHLGERVGSFPARSFFPPRLWSATRDRRRTAAMPLDVKATFQAWEDSTALPVLLGALDSALPLPFEDPVGEIPKRPWMAAVLAGASRVLRPWRKEHTYPTRGHGRRPFPAQASVQDAQDRTLEDLLGPGAVDPSKDWTGAMALRGALAHVVAHGVLEPNSAHAPTCWVPGRHWAALLASFPPDLVEAGRQAGAIARARFDGMDVHAVLSLSAPAGSSRHQAFAFRTGHVLVDEALSAATAWLRPQRRRITAPMIDKDDA